MRLQHFTLDRFGHFEDKTLDFSSDAIHVIHGPNASGKSTIRAAISELLFGIDERTTYNFKFENSLLRLSAKIASRDNIRDITISRHKRRARSLTGPGDVELDDNALLPFLGGLDRTTFLDLYVMDQDALRIGGEHMLTAEGDVGRSLFAASSGFADISALRAALKAELDEIGSVSQRRKSQKIWARVDEYSNAKDQQRASLLRKPEWDGAQKALKLAYEKSESLTEERQKLEASRSLLERIKAVSRVLPRLDQCRQILEELAAVPDLPQGFPEKWRKAEGDLQSAIDAEATAKDQKERLKRERDALPQQADSLLGCAEEIESLHQDIGNINELRRSQIKLQRDVEHDTDRINASLAEMGSVDHEANVRLLAAIPAKSVCTKVEELIGEKGRLDTALNASTDRKDRAQESLDNANLEVEKYKNAVDPTEAEAHWKAILGQGNVRRQVTQAQQQTEKARAAETAAIAKLAPWTGTAEDILKLPLPSDDAVASYAEKFRQNDSELKAARDAEGKAKSKLKEIDELIDPKKLAGEVPTESTVRAARSERDGKWNEIAGPAEAGNKVPSQILSDFAGLVQRADDLVDLAVASNELPGLLRNRASLVAEFEESEARVKRAKDQQTLDLGNWSKLWHGLAWPNVEFPEPQKMQTWLAQIKICLIAIDTRVRAETAQADAETEAGEAKESIKRVALLIGITPAPEQSVDETRDQVSTALSQSRRNWDALKRAEEVVQQSKKEHAAASKECDGHQTALDAWKKKWAESMPLIHQKAELEPSDCRHILGLWATIRDQHTERSGNQRRLDGVKEDLADHEKTVRSFIEKLGEEKVQSLGLPEDWALWPAKLHRVLQEASGVSMEIKAADRACESANRAHEKSVTTLANAQKAIGDLRNSASLATDVDVADVIERFNKKKETNEQLTAAQEELDEVGDGLPEAKLREEVATIEPDQVRAQLATVSERTVSLDESVTQASQELLLARQQIAKLEERTGFTVAGLNAATAAQDIKELAQRWMRLRAAQILLDRAVEGYRKANEAPLIRRASELFSAIVKDRLPDDFTRLEVDYENPEKPILVARRKAGTSCTVPKMSTGTRDQLWLSLRIAALEKRAEHVEPMPFLADDLFDSSDEPRSIGMLTAIAELARHTQVIIFTHHEHVAKIATDTLGARAQLHRLQSRA